MAASRETVEFTEHLCDGIEERTLNASFAVAWNWAAEQIDAYVTAAVDRALREADAG